VPQRKDQATAATQPFPVGDATVRQDVPASLFNKFKKSLPKGTKYANGGRIFTPYGKGFSVVASPSALGGTNWPPSSYNPSTQYLYACGANSDQVFSGGKQAKYTKGKNYLGSAYTPFGTDTGTFTALDTRTNKIAWQQQWPTRCYSGSMTTAGGLVFTGRNDGRLQALDASSGKVLWNFQTGAGANNVPTVVQQNGNEYIVFYAGGSALGATSHGDDLWLFALNGKLGPVKAGSSQGGVQHTGENQSATAIGQQIFANNCSVCHGALGQGGNGGPDLQNLPAAGDFATVVKQVTNGGGAMPPFKGKLTKAQINDVATYVTTKIHK
jgi:alcohol dehydrogenase (cytochrome c)